MLELDSRCSNFYNYFSFSLLFPVFLRSVGLSYLAVFEVTLYPRQFLNLSPTSAAMNIDTSGIYTPGSLFLPWFLFFSHQLLCLTSVTFQLSTSQVLGTDITEHKIKDRTVIKQLKNSPRVLMCILWKVLKLVMWSEDVPTLQNIPGTIKNVGYWLGLHCATSQWSKMLITFYLHLLYSYWISMNCHILLYKFKIWFIFSCSISFTEF